MPKGWFASRQQTWSCLYLNQHLWGWIARSLPLAQGKFTLKDIWWNLSTKETTKYARLCCLLVDIATQTLRDTFDTLPPPQKKDLGFHQPLVFQLIHWFTNNRKKREFTRLLGTVSFWAVKFPHERKFDARRRDVKKDDPRQLLAVTPVMELWVTILPRWLGVCINSKYWPKDATGSPGILNNNIKRSFSPRMMDWKTVTILLMLKWQ